MTNTTSNALTHRTSGQSRGSTTIPGLSYDRLNWDITAVDTSLHELLRFPILPHYTIPDAQSIFDKLAVTSERVLSAVDIPTAERILEEELNAEFSGDFVKTVEAYLGSVSLHHQQLNRFTDSALALYNFARVGPRPASLKDLLRAFDMRADLGEAGAYEANCRAGGWDLAPGAPGTVAWANEVHESVQNSLEMLEEDDDDE